ncbi:MAG TPA: cation:proton antiporter, partial [Pyrinomonadaceae bacterium]
MPVIFAAGTIPPFLTEVVALLVAGAVIAYVCYRIGLVPIVGFLLAGVVIGPNALGLVRDRELVDAAAEVGVILLLFTIGIEFSLQKLARIKRLIFGGGGLQVGLATLSTMGVLALFGVDWRAGLFTGFLVALSSTAIVLKLLGDRGETGERRGQVGLGLLIFQDLAIIVMVLLVPVLSGSGGSTLGIVWALAKAGAIIAAVLIFARRLMPRMLEMVARTCSPELFLLTVIAICFGTAYLTSLAGVSLSLGAFLAGLLVSESRFSEHALSEIMPLQILFSATFFVSVGMLLDLSFLAQNLPLVLVAVAIVLVVKVATTGVSVLALGYRLPVAAASGLMLAQVGEFSFVLERAGREVGLSPAGLAGAGSQTFIASTVVLMVLTPLLMQVGSRLSRRLETKQAVREASQIAAQPLPEHLPHLED